MYKFNLKNKINEIAEKLKEDKKTAFILFSAAVLVLVIAFGSIGSSDRKTVSKSKNQAENAKKTEIESIEYQTARGIACGGLIFLAYKIRKRDEIRLSKFITEPLSPRVFYLYVHCNILILELKEFMNFQKISWLALAFDIFTHKHVLTVIHYI